MTSTIKHNRNSFLKHYCRCDISREDSRRYKREYNIRHGRTRRVLDGNVLVDRLIRDGRQNAVPSDKLHKWRTRGIEVFSADRWAIRLGYHPLEIWGQEFYVGVSEMDMNYD